MPRFITGKFTAPLVRAALAAVVLVWSPTLSLADRATPSPPVSQRPTVTTAKAGAFAAQGAAPVAVLAYRGYGPELEAGLVASDLRAVADQQTAVAAEPDIFDVLLAGLGAIAVLTWRRRGSIR